MLRRHRQGPPRPAAPRALRPVTGARLRHDGPVQPLEPPGPVAGREQDAVLALRALVGAWSSLAAYTDGAGLSLDPAVIALRHTDSAFNAALVVEPDLDAVGRAAAWFGDREWHAWSSSHDTSVMLAALGHHPVAARIAMTAPASEHPRGAGFRDAVAGEVLELVGVPRESLAAGSGLVAVLTDDAGSGALLFAGDAAAGVPLLALRHDAVDRRHEVLAEVRRLAGARGLRSVTCFAEPDDEALCRDAGFEAVARWTVTVAPSAPVTP